MKEEVLLRLLNGVPTVDFIVFFIAGSIGGFLLLAINTRSEINNNPNTPNKFSWKWAYIKKGFLRFVISVISLVASIIFQEELTGFFLSSEEPIKLTLWSAFMVGMGLDQASKKFISLTSAGKP